MFATSFVLGYHGCDKAAGERILSNREHVATSKNRYDWLGTGSYFWENNPRRAFQWADILRHHPKHHSRSIAHPFVVGAVINLGNCLDLSDATSLEILKSGYDELERTSRLAGTAMPANEAATPSDLDLVKRHLDCAVINFVHALREKDGLRPFDTVRGPFTEGGELYPGSKIMAKTHVQICVRDPETSVMAYFRPRGDH